jgi:hypothetical protein
MARIVRLYADQLEAGDILVVKEGSIRKYYHICELSIVGQEVRVTYNGHLTFEHLTFDADDRVRVRE